MQGRLNDLEAAHSTALAMKENELGQKHRELISLRDENSNLRGNLEAQKLAQQKTSNDLEMAESHIETLQSENV